MISSDQLIQRQTTSFWSRWLTPELELVLHYESGLDLQQLHHLEHVEPEFDEPALVFHLNH